MSEPHTIVFDPVLPRLTGEEMFCPVCRASWQGGPIPVEWREKYYGGKTHWHRLIGVEVPGGYDGVHHWECPDCKQTFPRKGIS